MESRQNSIALPLTAIESGVSGRRAAKTYRISCSTLSSHWAGGVSSRSAQLHQQWLSPEQEKALRDWILEPEPCGYAPSHARAREMATFILKLLGDTTPLGKK